MDASHGVAHARAHGLMPIRWFPRRWWALARHLHASARGATPQERAQERALAFETFFVQYDRQVTGYLWRMLGDEQSASELAQETFLRAWEHFDEISTYERPLAWLLRVATNLALQQRRRRATSAALVMPLHPALDPAMSDPTGHVAERELVQSVLQRLPLNQRAALLLREVYGFSCAEIGDFVHASRDAAKMLLFRAREQFRLHYLQENETTP